MHPEPGPVDPGVPSLEPLAGGHSGETFLGEYVGERAVVRIYGPRSAWRGPDAPEVDAAVLALVRGLVPVPRVLEVRRGDPATDLPGLLVTSYQPGERLDLLLPSLGSDARRTLGGHLGTLLGRLGHVAMPRPGLFAGPELAITPMPAEARDLPTWVAAHVDRLGWAADDLAALAAVADAAQDLLDTESRTCLVHSDLNPKNLLVDPDTLEVTAVLDWEFAHAGSPYADLGNLLRFERDPVLTEAALDAYRGFLPAVPDDVLDRARAADLFALVDLAARAGQNPVADAAHDRLLGIARSGDPGWTQRATTQ
ncbi:translation initiation factor IF-2 [Nocardioides guangzhouensis]|uniref:Translation initiation factor IF-2 n=1 Tax=Nocardioides guangzhouensis TaxID=2497878 RepID=A0A4Q4ZCB5_9ACTN|nr:phosphotransferase [Nocardioides guangzhouensis]RYP84951.1 translation initiation factor IF-2 [Nocardioides guangzhouensis]